MKLLLITLFTTLTTLPLTISALELTAKQMANVNLTTTTVAIRKTTATITVNGTLRAGQLHLFRVSPVVDGLVTELKVVEHTTVHKGQILARLHSNTLGQAQTDYLEALAQNEVAKADYLRIKGLSDDGVVAKSRLLAAQSEYKMADAILDQRRRKLTLAGMNKRQIKRLALQPDNIASYTLLSPANGILLDVAVESGQMLAAGESAFRIADLSIIWADIQIPITRIGDVALGHNATIQLTAYPQQRFGGRLEALSGEVETNSQTLSGRIVIENKQGLLRPGMYVQAELQGNTRVGLMVPVNAVFRRGNDNYVFVVVGERNFDPVKITTRRPTDGWVKVEAGLKAGDIVVSGGVAELKSHWQYQGGE